MCLPQRGHGSDSPETEPLSDTLLADGGHYIMLPFNQSPGTSIHSFHSISQITATRSFNRVITPTTPPKESHRTNLRHANDTVNSLMKHLNEWIQLKMGPPVPIEVVQALVKNYNN